MTSSHLFDFKRGEEKPLGEEREFEAGGKARTLKREWESTREPEVHGEEQGTN